MRVPDFFAYDFITRHGAIRMPPGERSYLLGNCQMKTAILALVPAFLVGRASKPGSDPYAGTNRKPGGNTTATFLLSRLTGHGPRGCR
jgi:hypothetical protein